jgi:hypothetical protein
MSAVQLNTLAPPSVRMTPPRQMTPPQQMSADTASHHAEKHDAPCGMRRHASPRLSPCDMKKQVQHHQWDPQCAHDYGRLVLWFLLVTLLAWFLLWSLKPITVLKTDAGGHACDEVDDRKVLIGALATGLIVVVILLMVQRSY